MFRILQKPLEGFVYLRNLLYLKGFLKRCKPKRAKVISVGNLSVGGTGKTPTVMEIAKFLHSKGLKVSVLLRGYKRKSSGPLLVADGERTLLDIERAGDEAYLYARLLKGVSVAVAERRCEGFALLEEKINPNVIVLDDALQHLKAYRDFDIVLLRPKDLEDLLLPFGRLREPPSVLRLKGDYCLFTKCHPPQERLERLCRSLGKPFGYADYTDYRLLSPEGEKIDPESLKGLKLGAVSALGDNQNFLERLKEYLNGHGLVLERVLTFEDHFDYSKTCLDKDLVWITTFKDFFKLQNKGIDLLIFYGDFKLPKDLLDKISKILET